MTRNRLQKQPVLTYVPAVPAIAARPAFCESYQVLTGYKKAKPAQFGGSGSNVSSSSTGGSSFISVEQIAAQGGHFAVPAGATAVYGPGVDGQGNPTTGLTGYIIRSSSNGSTGAGFAGSGSTPIYKTVTTCYDAVEGQAGSPARVDSAANNGWNGGARSIDLVPPGAYFDAELPSEPLGVLIGLSDGQFNHSYSHPTHALAVRPSGVTPVEKGVDVGSEVAGGSLVRMARTADGVKMYIDGELIHTSNTAINGPAYVDATLYALSDFVQNPVIGVFSEAGGIGSLSMQGDLAAGGTGVMRFEGEGVAVLNGVTLVADVGTFRLRGEGQPAVSYSLAGTGDTSLTGEALGYGVFGPGQLLVGINGGRARLAAAGYASDSNAARGVAIFPYPNSEGRGGRPEAEVTQGVAIFPYPQGTALAFNGTVASGEGSMAMVGKGADNDYAYGDSRCATVYQAVAWEPYWPDDKMDGGELVFTIDNLNLNAIQLFLIQEGITINEGLTLYVVIDLSFYDALAIDDNFSLASLIRLMLSERVAVNDKAVAASEALQYAVNAVSGALTRYEDFGFEQFATVAGVTYGIKDGGLYRLQGDTDDGQALDAHIDFGASDFGTAQGKRISSVYAGIATDGCVYLRVTGDDGEERIYRTEGDDPERRARTAKGLVSRHWRLRLELMDASYADLDNIEIELGVSQRRLRSRR